MTFEWDDNKEQINIKKHGIDFETASHVFDGYYVDIYDEKHSDFEDRYIAIGIINQITCIVTVVYTERGDNTIRIISARKATKEEREMYYDYS